MRGVLATVSIVLTSSALAQLPARPTAMLPASTLAEVVVTDIALAYAAADPRGRLQVEAWSEDGVAVGETLGERVDYFTVVPEAIELGVGGRLDIANIQIVTYGLDGDFVPRAPLKISVEVPAGMLDIDSAVSEQALLALKPGIGRLWIESLLPRGTGTGELYRLPVPILVR